MLLSVFFIFEEMIFFLQNFRLKAVDETEYGLFYTGDAYVVLYVSKNKV